MEVGAVKQAFNNEVIQLKKKLDQSKIQIINKLTRKAKTLTQKKAPEHLAEKLKRKATSAVNDVMAIKKINNKDIAKFAITHTGNLNDFLNKPTSSPTERACARLLLHRALQDKYKLLRSRFMDVPIKDLFMSRQERLKIKKEEKEKQKLKKKEKEDRKKKRESEKKNEKTPVQAEGDWNVEDIDIDELILNKRFVPKRNPRDDSVDSNDGSESQFGDETEIKNNKKGKQKQGKNICAKGTKNSVSNVDFDNESEVGDAESDLEVSSNDHGHESGETVTIKGKNIFAKHAKHLDQDWDLDNVSEVENAASDVEVSANDSSDDEDNDGILKESNDDESDDGERESNKQLSHTDENVVEHNNDSNDKKPIINGEYDQKTDKLNFVGTANSKAGRTKLENSLNKKQVKEDHRKKLPKLNKDKTKTKQFSEKMLTKKTKIDTEDIGTSQGNKIVDPFFITATGENYMSVAEPRGPDEVKDVHIQGNRQMRRAAMFGYAPKARPKFKDTFNNNKRDEGNFSKNSGNRRYQYDAVRNGSRNNETSQNINFEKRDGYQKTDFGNKNVRPNNFHDNSGDRGNTPNFKRKFQAPDSFDKKNSEPEKLHPSWAAKKKISAILPFQGKKTVFE